MISIRRHLTLGLLVSCALLLTASGVLVWLLVRGALLRQFDASLRARAALLQSTVEEDDGLLQLEMPLELTGPGDTGAVPTLYQVWSAEGESALKAEALGARDLPRPALPAGVDHLSVSAMVLADGMHVRGVAARFDAADDKKGLFRRVVMMTARPTERIESTLNLLFWVLTGTGLVALVVMVPIIRWVLERGLRPLGQLAARTAAIDVRQLHTRLPEADSPVELRPVTARLNELLSRLEASFERERRFSSDVAHELRTPVAELLALGELAEAWPDQASPAAFAQVRAIAEEMREVISRLTLLARAEAGTQPVELQETALEIVVLEVVERFAEQARHRGLTFNPRLQPVCRRTDALLLRMILTNLIGNAVHHAPAGSGVDVILDPFGITVRNQAPGLTSDDLPRLLERFWRKDASRTGYGHSGLGLSLAHSLAELIDWDLIPLLTTAGQLEMRLCPRGGASAGESVGLVSPVV